MSREDWLILLIVDRARRDTCGETASTTAILARLPMFIPERTLRYKLKKLERRQLLCRPLGPKSGWAVTQAILRGMRSARRVGFCAA